MRKKLIVAFSALFQEMFLSKDIFLVPYYIAKETGGDLTYYYINNLGNTEIPQQHRGATLLHVETKNEAMADTVGLYPLRSRSRHLRHRSRGSLLLSVVGGIQPRRCMGLAELRVCSFSRRYVLRIVGTVRMVRHRDVHLVLGKEGQGVL